MAEFSKQYCEIYNMGFDGDFDVYEEWSKLQPGYAISYICEGFGFCMIGKEEHSDKVLVYVRDWETENNDKWIDFDELILSAKSNS
jgi:hypothetical protein